MNRPSDWQERERALDLEHSYIVQAPAGSGKTELLTQRLLALLARSENPEEVVAITFTRKAAAEMSHRLVTRLQAAARQHPGADANEELPPHEQVSRELALSVLANDAARGWNLLEQPSRLRIRTIDSLCWELARQLPVLSGLGGGQQIAENASDLYRNAAARTMAVIEDEDDPLKTDVTRVLDRYDNRYDKLVELLTGMLASREQWTGHLLSARRGEGFDRQGMEVALRYLVEGQLEIARAATPDSLLRDLPRFYNYAIGNGANNSEDLEALLNVCGGPACEFLDLPTHSEALPHWKTMISSLLTAAGEMRKGAPNASGGFPAPSAAKAEDKALFSAFKDDFKAVLDTHRENETLRTSLNTVMGLPRPGYEDEAWESLESLMRIMLRAAENWKLVMAEQGEVDYSEIAHRAIESLGYEDAPSNLALRMDYRIGHLLVDEFQDTSSTQIRLLRQLTAGWSDGDGRTLFLVGDPMQSIYRFRKAEVSLFIEAWQGQLFDHIQLHPIQLKVNFRSCKPIVDWVNLVFPRVMPVKNDPVMGAVNYSAASIKPGVSTQGCAEIQILPGRDDVEEARRVVEIIRRSGTDESIAILVRSRNHVSAILTALDKLKINEDRFRYQAIKFTPLAETTLVQDLVSLTLALIQPADRLAWLATLRAPYIGLDLADLDTLVAGEAGNIIADAVRAASEGADENFSGLSDNGLQRLQRAGPILLRALDLRGRQAVRTLVESAWIDLGGPACVGSASELDDAATYFDLIDSLEAGYLPVDRDTLDLRLKELYAEPDTLADGKLQILTIHSAKGLQFDTVILPGLNRDTGGNNAQLLHWFELPDLDTIVMSPMRNNAEKEQQKKSGDLIQFISGVERQRESLEVGRLLYVATTRAVRNLHLIGAVKPAATGEIKVASGSLLGSLWPAIEQQQTAQIAAAAQVLPANIEQADEAEQEIDIAGIGLPQQYRRLAADWQPPEFPKGVQLVQSGAAETQSTIEFSWAGEDARLTGNLVHRLLQLIAEQGQDAWSAGGGIAKHVNWCRRVLSAEGVQTAKADLILERATLAIENCQSTEIGRWILGSHEDAHCEYAITAVLDKDRPVSMVLDRTFVENGTRWIIDYKTSSHGGGDLEGFLENEAKRYRQQLQRYRDALALTETHPIRTALYFPLLDRLKEVLAPVA
ncbi:MAG: UvrD-helicase domain-containing protein [Lysobacterales bacterium]